MPVTSYLSTAERQDISSKFLSEVIRGTRHLQFYDEIFHSLTNKLGTTNFSKIISDDELLRQLVLHQAGPEIRAHWGAASIYRPELLREPYLPVERFESLSERCFLEVQKKIAELTAELVDDDDMKSYQADARGVFGTLLNHMQGARALESADTAEVLGELVHMTLEKRDIIFHSISNTEGKQEENAEPSKEMMRMARARRDVDMEHKGDFYNISAILNSMKTEDTYTMGVSSLADRLLQTFSGTIPGSIRTPLWSFRLLSRREDEIPIGNSFTWEFKRLTKSKMMPHDFDDLRTGVDRRARDDRRARRHVKSGPKMDPSAMRSLHAYVQSTVERLARDAFPLDFLPPHIADMPEMKAIVARGETPDDHTLRRIELSRDGIIKNGTADLQKLLRRTEHLVYAGYVINGAVQHRIVAVGMVLLRTFPSEPPTSEMMLRMTFRLSSDLLPSEQLQKDYSLATVALSAWQLLAIKDSELHAHLQEHVDDVVTAETSNASRSTRGEGQGNEEEDDEEGGGDEGAIWAAGGPSIRATVYPKSFILLRGWLETCFVGWLPEHGALFLWDQLVLRESSPSTFKQLLPRLCCALLQLLRVDLLKTRTDFVKALRVKGQRLRSRAIIETVKVLFSDRGTALELEARRFNDSAVVIQRMVRGFHSRNAFQRLLKQAKAAQRAMRQEAEARRSQLLLSVGSQDKDDSEMGTGGPSSSVVRGSGDSLDSV